jgi:hypothetical protein
MSYESIPNPTKKGKKWDYRVDKNMHHKLPDEIVELLKRNALKYTHTKAKKRKSNVV